MLKVFNILKELNPDKAKLFSYSDFTIIKTKKNSKFPIHDDTPNKLLSGVVYLYPEQNEGTTFYSNKVKRFFGMEMKLNLNGRLIELFFFQGKKEKLGILTKQIR